MKKLKFGIIGAGSIAQTWAQAIAQSASAELETVADIREDVVRPFAESFGCKAYQTHKEMVEKNKLDGVIICTPPLSHPEISLYCIENKINVICEKPFSVESQSARAMRDAAKKAVVLLTMASKFRYVEDVIRAKSILQSGILGDVILFENAFTSRVTMKGRWNADPQIAGGGVLIDNGTHSLDIVRYFLGAIKEIEVVEGKRSQGLSVEETVRIFVRTESDTMGSIDLSWSISKEQPSYINIYGTYGTISVGWQESKYRQLSSPDWIVYGNGYNKVEAFVRQLENFCRAIRGEEKLLITAEDAIASVEAVEAGYRALKTSQWTAVPY